MKISLLGCSGSGKTTLARELASALDLPLIELDEHYWGEDWGQPTPAEFKARVLNLLQEHKNSGWIIDGNYQSKLGTLIPDSADVVIWFNMNRYLVTYRTLKRALKLSLFKEQLWNGNTESILNIFKADPYKNIVRWTWTQHSKYREWGINARPEYMAKKKWYEVNKSSDVEKIKSLLTAISMKDV